MKRRTTAVEQEPSKRTSVINRGRYVASKYLMKEDPLTYLIQYQIPGRPPVSFTVVPYIIKKNPAVCFLRIGFPGSRVNLDSSFWILRSVFSLGLYIGRTMSVSFSFPNGTIVSTGTTKTLPQLQERSFFRLYRKMIKVMMGKIAEGVMAENYDENFIEPSDLDKIGVDFVTGAIGMTVKFMGGTGVSIDYMREIFNKTRF